MSELRATLQSIADTYARRWYGVDYAPVPPQTVDVHLARRIADAYDDLPIVGYQNGLARMAYNLLALETAQQYQSLWDIGMRFQPDDTGAHAYPSADAMRDALDQSQYQCSWCLWVYNGGADHPMLSRFQNWQFRAVHDVFGHYLPRASFGPNGEERAWRSHSQMFSPWAHSAMTTETRGQNSWVNFSPGHETLAPAARPYAVQKAALLPLWAE